MIGDHEIFAAEDLKDLKDIALQKYCDHKKELDPFLSRAKFIFAKDTSHRHNCILKHLADEKLFKMEFVQSNSEIMSVENCEKPLEMFNIVSQTVVLPLRRFFGVDIIENEKCFEDLLKKNKPMEKLYSYAGIHTVVQLTPKLQLELEEYKQEVLQSVKSHHYEMISCFVDLENFRKKSKRFMFFY